MKYLNTYKIFENVNEINYKSKNLYELPELPEDLEILICDNNNLKSLPKLPENLKELWCHKNQLESLPELPESLEQLACRNNKLKHLPKLPDSLEYLSCADNQLESLPELPDGLLEMLCGRNNIKILPKLPYSLRNMYCHNNPLECIIPTKFLDIQNNEWLEDYYYPMINSYEGQKKILINDIFIYKELGEQLESLGFKFDPRIVDEFSIMKQDEWS